MKNRRVMLKLSGEALAGKNGRGSGDAVARGVARHAQASVEAGAQVGIVTGGGD